VSISVDIFDNQLYLILCAAQDDVYDGIDVCNIDLKVAVHVNCRGATISTQDDVYDGIHISNIDLKVTVPSFKGAWWNSRESDPLYAEYEAKWREACRR
jgi:hypothetical protein